MSYERKEGYNRSGWIETYTGRAVQPLNLRPDLISIADIAHALSNKCRYTGHAKEFYSVAEHSVIMARYAKAPNLARWCLMHDAVEAYLPDVPRPLKPHLKGWYEIEEAASRAVAARFKLMWPMPGIVKELDTRILVTEARQLLISGGRKWEIDAEPLEVALHYWTPRHAKAAFMETYRELFPWDCDPLPDPAWNVTSDLFDPYGDTDTIAEEAGL